MSPRTKHKVVVSALALFSVWPAIQMTLVHHYDVSPWKLAGFGMYSSPRPQFLGLEIFGDRSGGDREKLGNPTPELRAAVNLFLERWRWLGRLAHPDAVQSIVRQQRPEWDDMEIVAYKPVLNPSNAMIELSEMRFAYPASEN